MTNKRIVKLDIVRTIAIINVVLCHCVEKMYNMYNYEYVRTLSPTYGSWNIAGGSVVFN